MKPEYVSMKDLSGTLLSLTGTGRPIAIVDDDADDRDFMKREMHFLFGETPLLLFRNTSDLAEYLQQSSAGAKKPGLILLDIHMPGMDGYMTMEYLRRQPGASDIPIVVVSGTLEKAEINAALHFGAAAFLPKPLRRDDFIHAFAPKTINPARMEER